MKILKKVVTSKNKKDGYVITSLLMSANYLFIFATKKSGSPGSNGIFLIFGTGLEVVSEQNYPEYNIGLPKIIGDELRYFSSSALNKLSVTESREIFNFQSENPSGISQFDKFLVLENTIGQSFRYRFIDTNSGDFQLEKFSTKRLIFLGDTYEHFVISKNWGSNFLELQCLNYLTGDLVWSVDVTDWFPFQFDKKTTYKNQVRQLVIYQNLVLVNMNGHVVAFEIETGKEVWRYNLEQSPVIVYQFILDESDGHLWIISAVRKHQKGTLRQIDAKTGEILWTAAEPWDTHHPEPDYGDRWWWHFSMNKNFIFLTFESGFMGVMDKKTGAIVEWFKFTKRNGAVNHGHKLLNKTLYQPTDFEFLAIDVSEYFLDGDTMEVNSRED
jgi:hypothetical protein